MPVYDYACDDCGCFQEFRSIEERNFPAACPVCEHEAVRLIIAPNLALMNSARRHAFATNERSRHEPKISTAHSCSSRCGCGTNHSTKIRPNRTRDTKLGKLQSQKPSARPWMLGH